MSKNAHAPVTDQLPSQDTISALWAEQLKLDVLEPEHSFFDQGGNSLSALGLLHELDTRYGIHLGIEAIFQYPTLPEFYQHVVQTLRSPAPPPAREARRVSRSAMEGLWKDQLKLDTLDPARSFFDQGGDSLSALGLLHELDSRFGVELAIDAIFRHPTLSEFHRHVVDAQRLAPSSAPVRDPLSLNVVAELWKEQLQLDTLHPDQSFFDQGGDSLAALALLQELESRHGIELRIQSIFQHPTLVEFHRHLAQPEHADALETASSPPSQTAVEAHKLNFFYPLQPDGSKVPLFTFAHAPHIDQDRPGYYFEGIYGWVRDPSKRLTMEDIDAFVDGCIEDIKNVTQGKPIYLQGYCHGGFLALAIAQQLMATGNPVSYLGMLETYPRREWYFGGRPASNYLRVREEWENTRSVAKSVRTGWEQARTDLSSTFYRFIASCTTPKSRLRRLFSKLANIVSGSLIPTDDRIQVIENTAVFRRFEKRTFTRGIDGPVNLFLRSNAASATLTRFVVKRWQDAARGELNIQTSQGDHRTVRVGEGQRALAGQISLLLLELERH